MNPYYTDYAEYLRGFFPGVKVQKISVNTGAGCPNRDGTVGLGGCIYCNNASFTPAYCFTTEGVAAQLEAGKRFFARKYPQMKYIAYFQSYTTTHRQSAESLRQLCMEALGVEGVVGLAVGTRPDCIGPEAVAVLAEINKTAPVFVELGVESLHDRTLAAVNRGHTAADTVDAIGRLAAAGLHVGAHLIAGLPGESDDDVLDTVKRICSLPVESIKLHRLQLLRKTPLMRMVESGEVTLPEPDLDAYLELCRRVVETVPRRVAIERFLASAPREEVVSPGWGLKNFEFVNLLLKRLRSETQNKA